MQPIRFQVAILAPAKFRIAVGKSSAQESVLTMNKIEIVPIPVRVNTRISPLYSKVRSEIFKFLFLFN